MLADCRNKPALFDGHGACTVTGSSRFMSQLHAKSEDRDPQLQGRLSNGCRLPQSDWHRQSGGKGVLTCLAAAWKSFVLSAEGGNRTRTPLARPRILSPIPPLALPDLIAQHRTPINGLPLERLSHRRPSFATPSR